MTNEQIRQHRLSYLREDGKPLSGREWAALLGTSKKISDYELPETNKHYRPVPRYIAISVENFALLYQHAPKIAEQKIKAAIAAAKE